MMLKLVKLNRILQMNFYLSLFVPLSVSLSVSLSLSLSHSLSIPHSLSLYLSLSHSLSLPLSLSLPNYRNNIHLISTYAKYCNLSFISRIHFLILSISIFLSSFNINDISFPPFFLFRISFYIFSSAQYII